MKETTSDISSCCGMPVTIQKDCLNNDPMMCSQWYECSRCGKSCDLKNPEGE